MFSVKQVSQSLKNRYFATLLLSKLSLLIYVIVQNVIIIFFVLIESFFFSSMKRSIYSITIQIS